MEIPRYVKVNEGFFVEKEQVGEIYDTTESFPTHLAHCQTQSWESIFNDGMNRYRFFEEVRFPPSTIINDYLIY